MRPRAGHARTAISRRGKCIWLMLLSDGRWVPTGTARGWPRCSRCRRPTERGELAACDGMCSTCCYYMGEMTVEEFWERHESGEYYAPYNISGRNDDHSLSRIIEARDWRRAVADQLPILG